MCGDVYCFHKWQEIYLSHNPKEIVMLWFRVHDCELHITLFYNSYVSQVTIKQRVIEAASYGGR